MESVNNSSESVNAQSVSNDGGISISYLHRRQREMETGELDPIDTEESVQVNPELDRRTGKEWNPLVQDKGKTC